MNIRQCIATLAMVAVCSSARANLVGNDTQNFNPITSGLDFVTVHSSEILAPGFVNLGYFMNYAHGVLPEITSPTTGTTFSSNNALWAQDFNFGYGVLQNLEIGLNASHMMKQESDRNEPGSGFAKTGLNELRANGKYRIMKREPIGVAFVGSVNLNQVKNNPFLGQNPGPTYNLEAIVDTEYNGFIMAANVGFRSRSPGAKYTDSIYSPLESSQVIASAAISRYIEKISTKFIGEVFGSEFILGAKHDITDGLALHVGAGGKFRDGLFSPDTRIYGGLNYAFEAIHVETTASVMRKTEIAVYEGYQPGEIERLTNTDFDEIIKEHEFVLRRDVPESADVENKPPFEIVRLDHFDFDTASYALKAEHKEKLERLLRYLNSGPGVIRIRVEGHTDSHGDDSRNAKLSDNRAKTIAEYLSTHGLNSTIRVEALGYGAAKPVADNGNLQGRKQNRRVEVRLLRRIVPPKAKVDVKES